MKKEYETSRHEHCPLQDTTELLEALEKMLRNKSDKLFLDSYNKLKEFLGGKDE